MKNLLIFLILLSIFSFSFQDDPRTVNFPKSTEKVKKAPNKKRTWVFILAGQSNMAGRGFVEPKDTIPDKRILSVNKDGKLIIAKEPLHFYEPKMAGLDCGLSFAKALLKDIPENITLLIIPCAVGGSSISQWLGDSTHREVKLLANFLEKAALGVQYGQIKAVLWHQGESDATEKSIPVYDKRLSELFNIFRNTIKNDTLPILIGELGSFSKNNENWQQINQKIRDYSRSDKYSAVISTKDLKDKGDKVHFDSEGQRLMGQRFADAYLKYLQK